MPVKTASLTPVASGTPPFTDASPTSWYAPYVAAAYNARLISGTSAATFDPNASITRQEVAVITMRAMGAMHLTGLVGTLPAKAPTFADRPDAAGRGPGGNKPSRRIRIDPGLSGRDLPAG
ncbi:MAG: S-layer homology domain-containing protein [Peptococcaceae bacterium]|jgi:hypothetical protein|nr:S-layer homology domain-containing protein [Peptococcaceae bacterium]